MSDQSSNDEPMVPRHFGVVRMVVDSIEPSPGGRQRIRAHPKSMRLNDPFISWSVTVPWPVASLPYRAGDEFDLPLFPPAIRVRGNP